MKSDLRDPKILGEYVLRAASDSGLPAAQAYDRDRWLLEHLPPWQGDGFMSNNPDEHHSKTPQTEDWQ